jgi:disulfide bond formation protein DsbB
MLSRTETIRSLDGENLLAAAGFVVAAVSAAALAGAWIFEWYGYRPCPLCLEQRIPYYAAVPLGLLAAILARSAARLSGILLVIILALFVYNAGLGVYHAGAEWHFWPGPDTCSPADQLSVGNLAERLKKNTTPRCDEAALRIAGLSLAGYSVLISAGLALIAGFALMRSRFWRNPA